MPKGCCYLAKKASTKYTTPKLLKFYALIEEQSTFFSFYICFFNDYLVSK